MESPQSSNSSPEFESFRPYLKILVRGQIPVIMQSRLDASDIVQETLLEAHRKREQYKRFRRSSTDRGLAPSTADLQLLDALRAQQRNQRDVRREIALQQAIEESSLGLEQLLVADDTSPSQRFERNYSALRVARALEQLPEMQQQAIFLRYFQHVSLDDIAQQLEKTKPAVAGLIQRGLAALRSVWENSRMSEPSDGSQTRQDRIDGAVAEYLELIDAGQKPDREQWVARYPDLRDELLAFLAGEAALDATHLVSEDSVAERSDVDESTAERGGSGSSRKSAASSPENWLRDRSRWSLSTDSFAR